MTLEVSLLLADFVYSVSSHMKNVLNTAEKLSALFISSRWGTTVFETN